MKIRLGTLKRFEFFCKKVLDKLQNATILCPCSPPTRLELLNRLNEKMEKSFEILLDKTERDAILYLVLRLLRNQSRRQRAD